MSKLSKYRNLTPVSLLLLAASAQAVVHTMTIDMDENVLMDPGFESLVGTEPDAGSSPWFTAQENNDGNFRVSTNRAFTGSQSVVFRDYATKGAILQNVNLQVNPAKYYHLSFWMRVDEPSDDPAHVNAPGLNASIYSSATVGGEYVWRKGFFWGATVVAGNGWEKVTGMIRGDQLLAQDDEYIQLRIVKSQPNASHRIYIDHVTLLESDSEDPPGMVGRYLSGANLAYTQEEKTAWGKGFKIEVLKRTGMNNLRYPAGHVVSFWDWEWPYHDGYENFWDPDYISTLDAAESNRLFNLYQDRQSLDQYLEICEETGALPMIGINMMQGWKYDRNEESIAKAVRLVNYVKDKIDGPRYYYLDNEVGHRPAESNNVLIADYGPLIAPYSEAMKDADPLGKIVVNIMSHNSWYSLIRDHGQHVDLIDVHWYYHNRDYPEFWVEDWRADVNLNSRGSDFEDIHGWIAEHEMPHIKLGLLEWNIGRSEGVNGSAPGNAFYQGLVQADMMIFMVAHDVFMASTWPLTWNDVFRNLTDGSADYISPAFYIHRAFSKASGGTILDLNVPDVEGLRSLAVKSVDEGFIDLYVLNKSTNMVDLVVELPVPIVETIVMNYAQGNTVDEVDVSEEQFEGYHRALPLSLGDTSFVHVRFRLSDRPTSYELFSDNFDAAGNPENVNSAPYPVGVWHLQGPEVWSTESSDSSVDVGEFNGISGNELRVGWAVDEAVALYSTPVPIYPGQRYTLSGRWEVGPLRATHRGCIVGLAEFSAEDGSLVQRLTPDTWIIGNTNNPAEGDSGVFEVALDAVRLAGADPAPGNRIGVFIHRNNGDDRYDGSTTAMSDIYYIDDVTLEVHGSIDLLDQWMASNGVVDGEADSDGDGLNNRTEYYFGGDPGTNDASVIRPSFGRIAGVGTNWMEYVYRKRSDPALGLTFRVETTTNLVSGTWSTNGVVDAGFGSITAEIDSVTNRVSTEEVPEQFIRVRVW